MASSSPTASTSRVLQLYFYAARSVLSRLIYDLAREITVAISSLVLLATFMYVFNDFLNVEIAALSRPMRDSFATYAANTVLLVAAAMAGRCIGREHTARRSLAATAAALGEWPVLVLSYRNLVAATIVIAAHGGAWWVAERYLVQWPLVKVLGAETLMLVVTSLLYLTHIRRARAPLLEPASTSHRSLSPTIESASAPTKAAHYSKRSILSRWRLHQIIRASRATRFTLMIAAVFVLLAGFSAAMGLPAFVSAAAALAAGFLVALCLCFQISEDLEYSWFERCLGVSHDDFIAGYEQTGAILAAGVAILTFVLCLVAGLASGFGGEYGTTQGLTPLIEAALKAGVVAAIPALVAPSILLQIDGRRVFVTGLTLLIIALFIATAVMASWISLILIPVLRYFAKNSQAGRFYRA